MDDLIPLPNITLYGWKKDYKVDSCEINISSKISETSTFDPNSGFLNPTWTDTGWFIEFDPSYADSVATIIMTKFNLVSAESSSHTVDVKLGKPGSVTEVNLESFE